MIDSIIHFLLLPVVGWFVLLLLLGCTFFSVTNSRWGLATILHVLVVWFTLHFFNLAVSLENVVILAVAYFTLGGVNSIIQWYFAVKQISQSFPDAIVDVIKNRRGHSVVDKVFENISSSSSAAEIVRKTAEVDLSQPVTPKNGRHDDAIHPCDVARHVLSALETGMSTQDLSYTTRTIARDSYSANRANLPPEFVLNNILEAKKVFQPVAGECKSQLIAWITFWPTILTWTLISKPVRVVSTYIYNLFGNVYDRISSSAFK